MSNSFQCRFTGIAMALALTASVAHATPAQAITNLDASKTVSATTTDVASSVIKIKSKKKGFKKGLAIGLGVGITTGIIASQAQPYYAPPPPPPAYYAPKPYYGGGYDPRRRCARKFKSFEWHTGMYTGYDGYRRRCPYL